MKKILAAALLASTTVTSTAQGATTTTLPKWDEIEPLLRCAGFATMFDFEEQQRLRGVILVVADAAKWARHDIYYYMGWYDRATVQTASGSKQAAQGYVDNACHLLGREVS